MDEDHEDESSSLSKWSVNSVPAGQIVGTTASGFERIEIRNDCASTTVVFGFNQAFFDWIGNCICHEK